MNEVTVVVDSRESNNIPPFGNVIDYMTFGGIYREVYLSVGEKTHISDVFVKMLQVCEPSQMLSFQCALNQSIDNSSLLFYMKRCEEEAYQLLGSCQANERNITWKHSTSGLSIWTLEDPSR